MKFQTSRQFDKYALKHLIPVIRSLMYDHNIRNCLIGQHVESVMNQSFKHNKVNAQCTFRSFTKKPSGYVFRFLFEYYINGKYNSSTSKVVIGRMAKETATLAAARPNSYIRGRDYL